MGTIVQEYGPIYGEVVNGTVQGRPNGSVFVPTTNTITLSLIDSFRYCRYFDETTLRLCNSTGGADSSFDKQFNISAQAQDLASNIQLQLYSDNTLETLVASTTNVAGSFNFITRYLRNAVSGLTDGATLYARAQLMNNGVAVATSDVIEITMVVPS